jgi:hypothetical protein
VAPFLDHRGQLGYASRKWNNHTFPFTDDFLSILKTQNSSFNTDPLLDSYNVTISAVAAIVDAEATEKPEKSTLTLKSSDSFQSMDIYNYPLSQVFVWKPATAADTTLTINLPSLELSLNYSGPMAFPSFLGELIGGDLILSPSDFPDHEAQLRDLGITEIKILMKADGALPVIRYHSIGIFPLPTSIIKAQ